VGKIGDVIGRAYAVCFRQAIQYFSDHCPQLGPVVLNGLLLGCQMEMNDLVECWSLMEETPLND